jgi:hypothetical protein
VLVAVAILVAQAAVVVFLTQRSLERSAQTIH